MASWDIHAHKILPARTRRLRGHNCILHLCLVGDYVYLSWIIKVKINACCIEDETLCTATCCVRSQFALTLFTLEVTEMKTTCVYIEPSGWLRCC